MYYLSPQERCLGTHNDASTDSRHRQGVGPQPLCCQDVTSGQRLPAGGEHHSPVQVQKLLFILDDKLPDGRRDSSPTP